MINAAYESLVPGLRACSRDFYVKKQVNGIAGWSRKLSELKYNSRNAAGAWYLAGCPMSGVL